MAMNRRRCGWDENVLLEILTSTTTSSALALTRRHHATGTREYKIAA